MKSVAISLLLLLSVATSTAHAIEWDSSTYYAIKNNPDFQLVMAGVAAGISMTNDEAGNALYCPPKRFHIITDQYLDMLDAQMSKRKAYYKENHISLYYVLLEGLIATFPCEPKATTEAQ